MDHVVSQPAAPFLALGGALEVHQVPAAQDNLVWVIVCTATRECAIVDGPDASGALALIARKGFTLTTVLNTHTHGDHIGVNHDLAARGLLAGLKVFGPQRKAAEVPGLTDPVDEGDTVHVGQVRGQVWLTEGHIDGHVSFVFGDVVFVGDTMFAGGCGYLFDGPPAKMFGSLVRLSQLPEATRVCCAHEYTQDNLRFAWTVEPDNEALADRIRRVWDVRERGGSTVPSTIGEERATNPFLRVGSPMVLHVLSRALPNAEPTSPEEVFAGLRKLKDTRLYKRLPDDDLPL